MIRRRIATRRIRVSAYLALGSLVAVDDPHLCTKYRTIHFPDQHGEERKMRCLLSTLFAVLLVPAVNAETVVFWDGDATIGANGKYHNGLNFSQDSVYVEYVTWDGGPSGGKEIHVQNIDDQKCEKFHDENEMLLVVPNLGPRAKLKSLKYRFQDRYREGRPGNVGETAKLYVFVGNRGSLEPKTKPGGDGWLTYELKRNRKFDTLDFQAQSTPPPRGRRYYLALDNQANVFYDDIEVGR